MLSVKGQQFFFWNDEFDDTVRRLIHGLSVQFLHVNVSGNASVERSCGTAPFYRQLIKEKKVNDYSKLSCRVF